MIYQFENEEIEACGDCPCCDSIGGCALGGSVESLDEIPVDCPLVAISKTETTSWTMIDSDINLWKCSKCSEEWHFEFGGPEENNMHYCPNCGRRLEDSPCEK